jgi:hypothetical protein
MKKVKKLKVSTKVEDYGMYTDKGNLEVDSIVVLARLYKLPWEGVLNLLTLLAGCEGTEEATDTAVRESVYFVLFEKDLFDYE